MPLSVLYYFRILFSAPLRPRDLAIRNVIRRNDSVSVTLRWTDLLNFTTQTDARNTYNFSVEFSRLPTLMFVSDDQIPHRGEVIVDGVSLHQYIFDLLNFIYIFYFTCFISYILMWLNTNFIDYVLGLEVFLHRLRLHLKSKIMPHFLSCLITSEQWVEKNMSFVWLCNSEIAF